MIPTASLAEVQQLAARLYSTLRAGLFGPGHPSTPATLIVSGLNGAASANAGYSPSNNVIRIPVPEGNLHDFDALDVAAWPVWKIELVEELAHEYQHKAKPAVTATAGALATKYGASFAGPGHDDVFFAAVEVLAGKLGLDAEALVKILVNGDL